MMSTDILQLFSHNIDNHKLTSTNSTTYLGLHFTYKLNYEKHTDKIKQTTSDQLYKLKRLRPYMNRKTATQLAQTLILSRLNYCNYECLNYCNTNDLPTENHRPHNKKNQATT